MLQWGRVRGNAEINKRRTRPEEEAELQWGRVRGNAEIISVSDMANPFVKLQWGRVRGNAEIDPQRAAWATYARLQWGRVRGNAEMGGKDGRRGAEGSFNGAAFGGTRKSLAAPQFLAVEIASMGPRSGERGNPCPLLMDPGRPGASMGPRSGERGNSGRLTARYLDHKLQWGRVRGNAEMPLPENVTRIRMRLQWGRVRGNAEIPLQERV